MAGKMVHTMKLIIATTVATTLALTPLLAQEKEPGKRLEDAAAVFSEIMAAPDKGIPQDLLQKSHCIVIVPELKTAAFGVGGKYGKGYLSCRNKSGTGWSAPGTIRKEFALNVGENSVHGSDSLENAKKEISFFFAETDIVG